MKESLSVPTALFVSGNGTTAEAVLQDVRDGHLSQINPVVIIASTSQAPALSRLERFGIPEIVVERSAYKNDSDGFAEALIKHLQAHGAFFGAMLGWMPLMPEQVIVNLKGGMVNQHPGPLDAGRPDFGGKGMFGQRVTAARVSYALATKSDYWTAATVHRATPNYDEGAILREEVVLFEDVTSGASMSIAEQREDPSTLIDMTHQVHKRLRSAEAPNVVKALSSYGEHGWIGLHKRDEPLIPQKHQGVLFDAKQLAIELDRKGQL